MMSENELEVILTNQTFEGAGSSKQFPNLEMSKILFAEGRHITRGNPNRLQAYRSASYHLIEAARSAGCKHVFNVRVESEHSSMENTFVLLSGTGYRSIKPPKPEEEF
jgi:hypothetical protein